MNWKPLKLGARVEGIHTANMSRDEWLSVRMSLNGLGGSDIGTVCGVSKYKPNIALFWEKVGLKERTFTESRATQRGRLLEDTVGYLWQFHDGEDPDSVVRNEATGNKVRECRNLNFLIRNRDFPGMFANVDKHLIKSPWWPDKGILELKTMVSRVGEQYELGFPPSYLFQIQTYLMITGYDYGELAIFVTDKDRVEIFPIEADPEFQEKIFFKCQDFLARVKEAKAAIKGLKKQLEIEQTVSQLEPDPIPSKVLEQFYSQRHKMLEEKIEITDVPEDVIAAAYGYVEAQEDMKSAEEKMIRCKTVIQKYMRDNMAKRLEWDGGYIGWKSRLVIKPNT